MTENFDIQKFIKLCDEDSLRINSSVHISERFGSTDLKIINCINAFRDYLIEGLEMKVQSSNIENKLNSSALIKPWKQIPGRDMLDGSTIDRLEEIATILSLKAVEEGSSREAITGVLNQIIEKSNESLLISGDAINSIHTELHSLGRLKLENGLEAKYKTLKLKFEAYQQAQQDVIAAAEGVEQRPVDKNTLFNEFQQMVTGLGDLDKMVERYDALFADRYNKAGGFVDAKDRRVAANFNAIMHTIISNIDFRYSAIGRTSLSERGASEEERLSSCYTDPRKLPHFRKLDDQTFSELVRVAVGLSVEEAAEIMDRKGLVRFAEGFSALVKKYFNELNPKGNGYTNENFDNAGTEKAIREVIKIYPLDFSDFRADLLEKHCELAERNSARIAEAASQYKGRL